MTPLIGLSTYREPARWGVWDQPADLLPTAYADTVRLAGGVPVLLPPVPPYDEGARVVVDRIDGLVVAGGADVDPAAYAAERDPHTGPARVDRDAWELALLDAADAVGLPVLGVCRGMQVMAVHAGGELDQHLPDVVGHQRHDPGEDRFGEVEVRVAESSRLAPLVGERAEVRCHHHQSVRHHPGFAAVAWADDGTVEAMERPGDRFCLGVQWHPEVAADAGLFGALVGQAAAFSRARPGSP